LVNIWLYVYEGIRAHCEVELTVKFHIKHYQNHLSLCIDSGDGNPLT
jgi:hypothetical protein